MHSVDNNLLFGQIVLSPDTVASTNDYARQLLSKSKPADGTVIFTQFQEAGKGQFGKKWESEKGKNLLLSIIAYAKFLHPGQLFLLNQAVSLGVYKFARNHLPKEVSIKWPNDIYYQDRKIAGMLIENSLSSDHVQSSIIGIGVNVNQTTFDKNLPNPVSIKTITHREYDLRQLLMELLSFLEKEYLNLKAGNQAEIKQAYTKALYRLNELTRFEASGRVFQGKIKGVSTDGRLEVEVGGQTKYFSNSEIRYS